MRRGAVSANARWGNNIAILAGDYLFATASRLVSRLGPDAVRIIADTFALLVTGQMRETRGVAEHVDEVEHYLKVVYEKTACLIAASGRFGATFSGADDAQIERLARLGGIVGTAFQISDDIIDIDSDPDESGKVPGTDLRGGRAHAAGALRAARDGARRRPAAGTAGPPARGRRRRGRGAAAAALLAGHRQGQGDGGRLRPQAEEELAALPDGPAGRRWRHWSTTRSNRHG